MKRRSSPTFFALQLLALVFVAPVCAQTPFYLHPEDRVVFYGDSITQQALYPAFIETYVVTRFPGLNVRFLNSGWSGEWVVGGGGGNADERLARDVITHKPTVVIIMLGMNDGGYQKYDPGFFDVYSKGYQHLLEVLQAALPELRITLLEPSPFDDVTRAPQFEGGYNAVLVRYGQFVSELAQQRHVDVVDVNAPLVAVLQKAQTTDSVLAKKIIEDRIHPGAAGALVMAAAVLRPWHAPSTVTAVELDADRGRALRSENTRISELNKKSGLSWTQEDSALPLPVDWKDPVVALAARSSSVMESLDQQTLKINGLSARRYTLKIDGEEIGTWTKEEWAQGVNLALLSTPMVRQALEVQALTLRHYNVWLARWQGVQVGLQSENSPHIREALYSLDSLEDELLQRQRALATPKSHRYELVASHAE
jgi:lysophospholipase L1-like esterase